MSIELCLWLIDQMINANTRQIQAMKNDRQKLVYCLVNCGSNKMNPQIINQLSNIFAVYLDI